MAESFEVTEQHLTLLRHAYVDWDHMEFGAPAINPKRPYGNSGVYADIGELLGIEPENDDEFSNAQMDRMASLHAQTLTALQIILVTGAFETGNYIKSQQYDDRSWVKIDKAPEKPVDIPAH